MSCDKPSAYQHFQRTGTIPPYKSSSENYKKLFSFRQYSHQNLFQVELSASEKRSFDQTEPTQTRKKNGISGKIANRKKPRRRPTSHVVADEDITKQVMRSASVVYRTEEQCTSQRSLSMPASTDDVLVSEKELKDLKTKYHQGLCTTEPPRTRKSLIPVLKNSIWRRPSCRIVDK